jgi:hypothetical protein
VNQTGMVTNERPHTVIMKEIDNAIKESEQFDNDYHRKISNIVEKTFVFACMNKRRCRE